MCTVLKVGCRFPFPTWHSSVTGSFFSSISAPFKIAGMSNTGSKNSLAPLEAVRGMKILDRDAFKKTVSVPTLSIPVKSLKEAVKSLNPCFLKMPNLQPVTGEGEQKRILLHPDLFDIDLPYLQKALRQLNVQTIVQTEVELTYENYTADVIFKAVLPPGTTGNVSGYSIVGHIIHLNLKPDLMDFKYLIGQVLLDKYSNIRTVINKAQIIETEFRNLSIELIAGEPDYKVLVKENKCSYEFDFSKVFWNPRLVHEHDEISNIIDSHDTVYDVFAGVGPFAIPLAKKKCQVHANDLNPDSYNWLCHNASLNKVTDDLHTYNMDGNEFIQSVIKKDLIELWNSDEDLANRSIHILMNLPACALEFLKSFKGLLSGESLKNVGKMPNVYCYFFAKKDEDPASVAKEYLCDLWDPVFKVVRVVAPNKLMIRMLCAIPKDVLFCNEGELPTKRRKLNEDNLSDAVDS